MAPRSRANCLLVGLITIDAYVIIGITFLVNDHGSLGNWDATTIDFIQSSASLGNDWVKKAFTRNAPKRERDAKIKQYLHPPFEQWNHRSNVEQQLLC